MSNFKSIYVDDIIDIKLNNIAALALTEEILNKALIAYNGIYQSIKDFNSKIVNLLANPNEMFLTNQYNQYLELLYNQIQTNINMQISTQYDICTPAILSLENNNFTRNVSLSYKRSNYLWPTINICILDNMRLINLESHIVINIGKKEYILTKSLDVSQYNEELQNLKILYSIIQVNINMIESGKKIFDSIKTDLQID